MGHIDGKKLMMVYNFFKTEQTGLFMVSEGFFVAYYVYILQCKDGSYYTGHAKDAEKRFEMHKKGRGARYTRIHEPEELVYVEECETRGDAMRRERKIKTLTHDKKKQLIFDSKTDSEQ